MSVATFEIRTNPFTDDSLHKQAVFTWEDVKNVEFVVPFASIHGGVDSPITIGLAEGTMVRRIIEFMKPLQRQLANNTILAKTISTPYGELIYYIGEKVETNILPKTQYDFMYYPHIVYKNGAHAELRHITNMLVSKLLSFVVYNELMNDIRTNMSIHNHTIHSQVEPFIEEYRSSEMTEQDSENFRKNIQSIFSAKNENTVTEDDLETDDAVVNTEEPLET